MRPGLLRSNSQFLENKAKNLSEVAAAFPHLIQPNENALARSMEWKWFDWVNTKTALAHRKSDANV